MDGQGKWHPLSEIKDFLSHPTAPGGLLTTIRIPWKPQDIGEVELEMFYFLKITATDDVINLMGCN